MAHFEIIEHEGQKLVRTTMQGEAVRAEAGALHYFRGQIEMSSKAPSARGLLSSLVSGETVFKPTYTGTGEVYFGPPLFGEFVILDLDNEEWILDQGAYVCSDMGIEVGAVRNKAATALLGGEGLYQTSVRGPGRVVMQAPGQVQRLDLQGERVVVDGSFAIARSSTLDFSVRHASRSLVGSFTSGEGLLNVYEGHGVVLISPVPNLYRNLLSKLATTVAAASQGRSRRSRAASGGLARLSLFVVLGLLALCVVGIALFAALGDK